MIATASAFAWQARQTALQHAERSTRNLVVSVLDQVDGTLHQAEVLLGRIERRLSVATQAPVLMSDFQPALTHALHSLPAVQDVHVYDSAGRLVFNSYAHGRVEGSAHAREFFDFHRGSLDANARVGRPYRTEPQGEWVLPVSRRLFGPDKTFAGVAVVCLSVRELHGYLAKFDLGPAGLLALIHRDATVLVRHPFVESSMGADLSNSPLHQNHFSGARSGTFIAVSPFDGIERQYSFGHSSNHRVMAVVAMSKAHALADWQRSTLFNGTVAGLLILLIALTGRRTFRALKGQQRLTRELEASHRRLADLERAVNEHASVVISDVEGNITSVNQKFGNRSQYTEQDLLGSNLRMLKSGRHPASFYEEMWRTISQGGVWKGEIENRAKDGRTYWVATTIVPFLGETGRPSQYISIRTDITERKQAEQDLARLNQELARLAAHDELTGLANRRRFNEVLEAEFKRAQRSGAALSVLVFDVDFFKQFNDTYGHPAGDACLQRIAEAARSACRRPGDLAARWGGEEFVVLLPQTDAAGAEVVAHRLRQAVQALAIEHCKSPPGVVTISIGVHGAAPLPREGRVEELLHGADQALYEAKQAGRNRVALHRPVSEAGQDSAG